MLVSTRDLIVDPLSRGPIMLTLSKMHMVGKVVTVAHVRQCRT